MSRKRQVLQCMTKEQLSQVADSFELEVPDRRKRDAFVDTLAKSKKAGLESILSELSRNDLKSICRDLSLGDSGRAKDDIIARILGEGPSASSSMGGATQDSKAQTKKKGKPMAAKSKKKTNGNGKSTGSPFEQTFKNIDDVLWKEAGCSSELDYVEQTSWMLFLKYLDDLESEKAEEAELEGKKYEYILDEAHRWSSWAAPKKEDGSFDHDTALTGDDLVDYVNGELFPYLRGFKERSSSPDTIEYKVGEIFGEIKPKFQSGYSLRDALELVDSLSFGSQQQKHELSALYEEKIKRMGNAGRNGGEYYTPRPLIRAMIKVVNPTIGDRIYDGAAGSCGFLCEAYDYLRQGNLTTSDLKKLQTSTFYAKEKKSLAYVMGIMNMILHDVEAPNIIHTNTLSENILDIQDKDRFDVVLTNPPFGGKERPEVQQNFPVKTGETAFLFLQHFIKIAEGRRPSCHRDQEYVPVQFGQCIPCFEARAT